MHTDDLGSGLRLMPHTRLRSFACIGFIRLQSGGAQALPPSNKNYAVKIFRRTFLLDYSTGVQWPAPQKDNILGDQCQAPAR